MAQEEQEIFNALGLEPKGEVHAKDVIVGTLRRLHMSSRSTSQNSAQIALNYILFIQEDIEKSELIEWDGG
jgi:hypothetical protein